jgi:hypothetical protein
MRRPGVGRLCLFEIAGGESVKRIQAALHEPGLIVLAIRAPRPAEDQQLDLVGRVTDRLESGDPGRRLLEGVEGMLQGAPRARLLRQIGFRHARVGGAEDTLARAGIRLGENRDRRDARKGADGLHPDAAQEVRIEGPLSLPRELAVGIHQNVLSQVAAARLRVPMQGAPEVIPGAHLGQDLARQGELLAGIDS